ncbi:hypothetical protein ISN44_As08g032430 [Arabidopsis suecica]|uniref:Uncharacterized protein n=1 Tax=Arabidopsis suecica TaxID=45249 RepID=A0A8T2BCL3_ARASU|nr:hypothetical protein ISN44_As08g032430 [Arabidopsis suecica]
MLLSGLGSGPFQDSSALPSPPQLLLFPLPSPFAQHMLLYYLLFSMSTMAKRVRPSWYRESSPRQAPFVFESEDENDVVVLPQVDTSALLARLQLSLVGRMFHQGGRSIEALVSLLL